MLGMKICSNVRGDMTKTASSPIYEKKKNFKNLLLADDLEIWNNTASDTQVLPNLFNDDHRLTMTIFMKVKFVS